MRAGTPLEAAEPGYDYVGAIEMPHTRWVYACGGCGALVTEDGKVGHTRFHRALASLTLPTTPIGGS